MSQGLKERSENPEKKNSENTLRPLIQIQHPTKAGSVRAQLTRKQISNNVH